MRILEKGDNEGSAHLEMVISFTVFITFTIFLLYYLVPSPPSDLSNAILLGFQDSLVDYSSIKVANFLVKPNTAGCVNVDVSSFGLNGNSAVFDLNGSKITSRLSGSLIKFNVPGTSPVQVYVSEEFTADSQSCVPTVPNVIGSIKYDTVLSNNSLKELETKYYSDYLALKSELGLPTIVDFAVTSGNYLNATRMISSNTEVLAKTIFFDVLYANGTIEKTEINLQVWR